jgi:hypothetical protein
MLGDFLKIGHDYCFYVLYTHLSLSFSHSLLCS